MVRMTGALKSILFLLALTLLAGAGASAARAAACGANQRELLVTNKSTQPVWIGGGGGALRSVCVVDASTSCLANPSTIDSTTGACECGTQAGTLACPGTSVATGAGSNGGLNCACTQDSDCGTGAGCNTSNNWCYFKLPNPVAHSGAGAFTWKLAKSASPPKPGGWAEFCLDQASVSWNSGSIPSEVWWSGGVAPRTGCSPDGTGCMTGDCGASSNSDCPTGQGGAPPASLAEFTLQIQQNDFYDISVINGANIAEQMRPLPGQPVASPSGTTAAYWCKTPGLKTWQGGKCDWDFGKYITNVHYPVGEVNSYTPFLLDSSKPCSTANNPTGCPTGYTCSGAPGACYLGCDPNGPNTCPGSLKCVTAQDNNGYCQCTREKDCAGNGYCGNQSIPGKGIFLQQCGKFAGWWSADDFCAGNTNAVFGPLDCGAPILDGDNSSHTTLASLFACAAKGGDSAGNTTSCYNSSTAQTYPSTCCGCATYDQDDADGLSQFWPKNGTSKCAAVGDLTANDPVWDAEIQPWLVNLKRACPTAYSYPYDDPTSTFQCRGTGTSNLLGYQVIFMNMPKPPAP